MLTKSNRIDSIIFVLLALFIALFAAAIPAQAQKGDLPAWQNYKGVSIGMTAAQVKEKLGSPKNSDDGTLYYNFSDKETVDVMLDGEKKVRAVSVMYSEDYQNPPKFEDVFGKSAQAEPKADGSIYKLVRFTDAGYWVSYSRLAGDKAMVIVMIQKL